MSLSGILVLVWRASCQPYWAKLDALAGRDRVSNIFGNEWFVLVGAVACGLSAGLFWASEGAVALGYPEPGKKGKYMKCDITLEDFHSSNANLGQHLALVSHGSENAKSRGKVGYETYLIFVALQCVAAPLAIFLSPPEKVQRSDGSKVRIVLQNSWREEFLELWKLSRRKEVMLLLPLFWAAYFNQYSGTNFANLLSSAIISRFLDYKKISTKNRIKYSFFYVIAVHVVAWVYAWVIQEKYTAHPPSYDWTDSGFVEGFFVVLLWQFSQQALQNWCYYLISTMTDNISELCE
ncbi:predicted protein [Aspergillus terreus NIH2624]|uniref:Uncharacterized protein n=1 Tax=Aspergillus terreus (strain NIH 2624 / FGSC A1156) TaxID=341663 RepID=Q0CG80_ASPTN|nr:uncharacterized protein ATEG_07312 [Aspergillus terreus NIH2624]EAU32696.1 predicted protein [Aspergillus terreus NIH2624]